MPKVQKVIESSRYDNLKILLNLLKPVPKEWITKNSRSNSSKEEEQGIELLPCDSYKVLVASWEKSMKWTPGLDCALSVMLASITSTMVVGDQLWVKVISPASSGKTKLCEALSANKKYVLSKSTIRGFHSGFKADGDGSDADNSLISELNGKTLITKDGDTLMTSPNLSQVLSEARDVYDGASRTHYRNKMSKDYEGLRMTWILCGTSSLRSIDSSELGERFLDCVIMDGIDADLEDEVVKIVVQKSVDNFKYHSSDDINKQTDPLTMDTMKLTGGYITHLRENAETLFSSIDYDPNTLQYFGRLGKLVSYLRARPSLRQNETAEREFSARLASQLVRLGVCLSIVLNKKNISEVTDRVKKVALDTARGRSLEIVEIVESHQDKGISVKNVVSQVKEKDAILRNLILYMRQIGILQLLNVKDGAINKGPRLFLSRDFKDLYFETIGVN